MCKFLNFIFSGESIYLSIVVIVLLCFWCGCTIILSQLLNTDPRKLCFVFQLLLYSLRCVQMILYIMASRSYSFVATMQSQYHHHADLSQSPEHIKCWQIYYIGRVSKIMWIFPSIVYAIYVAVFLQLTNFSFDYFKNTCNLIIIIIIKSEISLVAIYG